MAFFNLTSVSRDRKADKLERLAWLTFRFASALLFFSAFPITASVMLLVALGAALSGKKGREKMRSLGENPWQWIKDENYRWAVLLPLVPELIFTLMILCGIFIPGVFSFYVLTFPIVSLIFKAGLCALGGALVLGLASWLLRPSAPRSSVAGGGYEQVASDYRLRVDPSLVLALVPAGRIVNGVKGRAACNQPAREGFPGVEPERQQGSKPISRVPGGGTVYGFSN